MIFSLVPERVQAYRHRKGLQKQKRQVLPVGLPEETLENLSCLRLYSCFLFCFVLSALNSSPPPPVSLLPITLLLPLPYLIFPHLPSSLPIHVPFPFMRFTPPLSFYCLSFCHFAVPSLFLTPLSLSPYLCISVNLSRFLNFSLCCSICLPSSLLAANTCDEEMLLCQNGGTCYQNQKCICPPEFKGVLCQHSRCEAGKDCNTASSLHLSMATLLLCTLLAHMTATLNPH